MQKTINDLLYKNVTRKEFLQHIGLLLLTLTGLGGIINYLLQGNNIKAPSKPSLSYGNSSYGGMSKNKFL